MFKPVYIVSFVCLILTWLVSILGGVFGCYDGRLENTLLKSGTAAAQCHMWTELNSEPYKHS